MSEYTIVYLRDKKMPLLEYKEHLPTLEVVAPQHKGSLLNSAFATELCDFIVDGRIDVWIYGHSHANINATIGNTRIVSNQMGYVFYGELRVLLQLLKL